MTKILHQLGHNHKWNLDAYFENGIGDGFIFTAFSLDKDKIGKTLSTYKSEKYMPISMIDLQFYGSKKSIGGKLSTYDFHPISFLDSDKTQLSTKNSIQKAIKFQEDLGFSKVIIPITYKEMKDIDDLLDIITHTNNELIKKEGTEYYMTIPFSDSLIQNSIGLEKVLLEITDMKIKFDGYFVVNEAPLKTTQKINTDYTRYENLLKIFKTLTKQDFKTIYGYSNFDALIFSSLVDIDYITIGSYENLRKFNIDRFTEERGGGPSEGWYFSEKLLNSIRANEIKNIRNNNALNLIKNEDNIFSDVILEEAYDWNTHKPDVHKNYLLSINRLLNGLSKIKNIKERASLMLQKVVNAQKTYSNLEENKVFLAEANSSYHLSTWESFLKSKIG